MELQKVKTGKERLIASGASMDGISIRRTGIAKVLWRKLSASNFGQSQSCEKKEDMVGIIVRKKCTFASKI